MINITFRQNVVTNFMKCRTSSLAKSIKQEIIRGQILFLPMALLIDYTNQGF